MKIIPKLSVTFTIAPGEKDVVQNTALAFVTATLYLLVQPRPKDLKAIDREAAKAGKKVHLRKNLISVYRTLFTNIHIIFRYLHI